MVAEVVDLHQDQQYKVSLEDLVAVLEMMEILFLHHQVMLIQQVQFKVLLVVEVE
tara:strand:+ start:83 stop:247 length:165 start_codon:yes stop_codon:yes gene_type:complete